MEGEFCDGRMLRFVIRLKDGETMASRVAVKKSMAVALRPRTTVRLSCLHLNRFTSSGAVQICTLGSRILAKVKPLFVEHDVEKRTVNFQATVVVNEA